MQVHRSAHPSRAARRRADTAAPTSRAPSAALGSPALPMPLCVGRRASLVSLLALLPLGFIVWIAIQTGWDDGIGAGLPAARRRAAAQYGAAGSCSPCRSAIVLAVALAWLTERTDLPGARGSGRGWRWRRWRCRPSCTAMPGSASCPACTACWAGVLVSVLAYFPFLYLPVAAQLRRLDPALEDAAASLGLGPWRVFFRVVLPQLRLAICGGSLLVGLHLLAEYGLYVHDPLRHLHDRDRRPVPVGLQRPGRQHAGRRAGAVLPRAAAAGGRRCAAASAMPGSAPARRGRADRRAPRPWRPWLACCLPLATALLALGVPF